MSQILDIILAYGPWAWFIFAVALMLLEMVVPGVHFLWYGIAAILVGLFALATGVGWQTQLITFGILSILTLFTVRRFGSPATAPTDEPTLNIRGEQYVGRSYFLEEAIAAGRGKIRAGDTLWAVEGPDMPKGARVKVVGANGTVLLVERDRG
jgi:hypothetical protein